MSRQPIGDRLFSFAVISDSHLNKEELGTNSPFDVNRLANRRLRYVIDDLNTRDIQHVIHLGDIVHPVPSNGDLYEGAANRFHEQISHLKHPFYLVPGNHDVGDKRMAWSPAGGIRPEYLDSWTQYFGSDKFSFEHQGVAFVGINAQLLGSALECEQVHNDWLELTLKNYSDKRVFLFSHYPPFLLHPEEDEHYDNLGSRGREMILKLIESYSMEALFAGHVHHFWYNCYSNCDCYLLPSTAFTRQDYSEMFRISPQDAFGRDDKDKLGYLIVHVHEIGHTFEMVRCHGREVDSDSSVKFADQRIQPVNPITNQFPVLGFDLRHDWLEHIQIPPSGGLDEFDRKVVRNDYPLLALWEMGARHLRIPLSDLADSVRRQRLIEIARLGFKFTLFSFLPSETGVSEMVRDNADLIDTWEVSGNVREACEFCRSFRKMADDDPRQIKLFFSPLKSRDDIIRSGQVYYHVINHGFTCSDFESDSTLVRDKMASLDLFDGVVLRCGIQDSVESSLMLAKKIQQTYGFLTTVQLRLTNDSPAVSQDSEILLCNRLAESMIYASFLGVDRVFSDTLADNDRGFFPRIGLVDREYNPRSGAKMAKILHALMSRLGRVLNIETKRTDDGLVCLASQHQFGKLTLILSAAIENKISDPTLEQVATGSGHWVDWETECMVEHPPGCHPLPLTYVEFN